MTASIRKALGLGGLILLLLPARQADAWGFGKARVEEPADLIQARDGVRTRDADPGTAHAFADTVLSVSVQLPGLPADAPMRQLDLPRLGKEAVGYLDKALAKTSDPVEVAILSADKGEMLLIQGDFKGADAVIRQALQAQPSASTLTPMLRSLDLRGQPAGKLAWCRYVRARLAPKADLGRLCELCKHHGADACDSPSDRDLLADRMRQRLEARDLDSRRGTSTDLSYRWEAVISIPVVNLCPREVPVFFGDSMADLSGVLAKLPPRSKSTRRLQIGSKVLLLDSQGYIASSIVVRNEASAITVNPSGNGFRPGTAMGY